MLPVMISQFGCKGIFYHAYMYLISFFKLSFQEFLEMMLSQANNDLPDENLDIADIFKVLKVFETIILKVLIFFHLHMFHHRFSRFSAFLTFHVLKLKVLKIWILHFQGAIAFRCMMSSNSNFIIDINSFMLSLT